MLQSKLKYFFLAIVLFFVGCGKTANTELEKKVEAMNSQIIVLQANLAQQSQNASLNEMTANLERIAYLTPGSDGYSTIKFNLGYLTVQLTDVKPYANGSKVTLKFGNVLSASIRGLKTTIDWGKVDANGVPLNDTAKSKEFAFAQTLRAGAWTPVTLVLEGVPPKELGFVRVHDVTHTGINLFN